LVGASVEVDVGDRVDVRTGPGEGFALVVCIGVGVGVIEGSGVDIEFVASTNLPYVAPPPVGHVQSPLKEAK
jgi:uncharacterized protein YraI